jgi:hypothetical protein
MYNFILQIAVVVSLGVIIYFLARAVERTSEMPQVNREPNQFDKLIAQLPLAKIDSALNTFFGKFLRKSKVVVMKVDNLLNEYINKLRKNGSSNDAPKEPLK